MPSWTGDGLPIEVGIIVYSNVVGLYIVNWAVHHVIWFSILEDKCPKGVRVFEFVSEFLNKDYECVYMQSTSLALFRDKITFTWQIHDKEITILNFFTSRFEISRFHRNWGIGIVTSLITNIVRFKLTSTCWNVV